MQVGSRQTLQLMPKWCLFIRPPRMCFITQFMRLLDLPCRIQIIFMAVWQILCKKCLKNVWLRLKAVQLLWLWLWSCDRFGRSGPCGTPSSILWLYKVFKLGDELIIDGLERDVCAVVLFAHEFYQVTDRPLITQYRAFRIFLIHQFPVLLIMFIECFNQHLGESYPP